MNNTLSVDTIHAGGWNTYLAATDAVVQLIDPGPDPELVLRRVAASERELDRVVATTAEPSRTATAKVCAEALGVPLVTASSLVDDPTIRIAAHCGHLAIVLYEHAPDDDGESGRCHVFCGQTIRDSGLAPLTADAGDEACTDLERLVAWILRRPEDTILYRADAAPTTVGGILGINPELNDFVAPTSLRAH